MAAFELAADSDDCVVAGAGGKPVMGEAMSGEKGEFEYAAAAVSADGGGLDEEGDATPFL